MDGLKCPKCGSTETSHWKNKKRQTVGHCNGCGKWVTFAKTEESSNNKEQATQTEGATASGEHSPSPCGRTAGGKRTTGTGTKKRGTVRTGEHIREFEEGSEATGGGIGGFVRAVLDFELF